MGRLEKLGRRRRPAADPATDFARYRRDPVGFARDVLRITPTPDQTRFVAAVLDPPFRVMATTGHNIGKTHAAAWLACWWYYTRDPGIVITTAPTQRDVYDLLWAEIRMMVGRAGLPDHFTGPTAAEMKTSEEHYAKGYTARLGESFQGRHRPNMLFIFDEAEGVGPNYWKTTNTMFQPDGSNGWFSILNPVTTTSQSYREQKAVDAGGAMKWRRFAVSSLDHPNIAAQLRGEPPAIPTAVTLAQAWGWLGEWFEEVTPGEYDPERDVVFPPPGYETYGHPPRYWRPTPDGEGRVLGRRPSAGTYGVWSERLWEMAIAEGRPDPAPDDLPQIGCDVARFGDDRTEMHTRAGGCSFAHEDHGGWDTVRTANRLMDLATEWATWATRRRPENRPPVDPRQDVRIKVDDTGVGGGVTDVLAANEFNVSAVNAGETADDADKYPRVRDELWFAVAGLARSGTLDLSRLPARTLARLEPQALAVLWQPTPDRRRRVESKEELKKPDRLGRSPDGMDAVNLAYYEGGSSPAVATWVRPPDPRTRHRGR